MKEKKTASAPTLVLFERCHSFKDWGLHILQQCNAAPWQQARCSLNVNKYQIACTSECQLISLTWAITFVEKQTLTFCNISKVKRKVSNFCHSFFYVLTVDVMMWLTWTTVCWLCNRVEQWKYFAEQLILYKQYVLFLLKTCGRIYCRLVGKKKNQASQVWLGFQVAWKPCWFMLPSFVQSVKLTIDSVWWLSRTITSWLSGHKILRAVGI